MAGVLAEVSKQPQQEAGAKTDYIASAQSGYVSMNASAGDDSLQIAYLPTDVLKHIATYLDSDDQHKIRRVCKNWNDAMQYNSLQLSSKVTFSEISGLGLYRLFNYINNSVNASTQTLSLCSGKMSTKHGCSDYLMHEKICYLLSRKCPRLRRILLESGMVDFRTLRMIPRTVHSLSLRDVYVLDMSGADVKYSYFNNQVVVFNELEADSDTQNFEEEFRKILEPTAVFQM